MFASVLDVLYSFLSYPQTVHTFSIWTVVTVSFLDFLVCQRLRFLFLGIGTAMVRMGGSIDHLHIAFALLMFFWLSATDNIRSELCILV